MAAALLFAARAQTVAAADEPAPGPIEQTIHASAGGATTPDGSMPDDSVSCTFRAEKPNYSGSKMTGVGGIKSCTPHAPFSCNSESEIEWYNPGPGRWLTVAQSNTQHQCPPPYRTTTAAYACEYRSSDPLYSYRTRVIGSIFYGETQSADVSGQILQVRCL
ncbi:hypothetical protein [Streptomyces naphthomycinicus]|uniref:hypothetical protein n=1 Tax=Streptomyces naphthomycinicus TaxID=2872625 RepID=UPI001CECCEF0|nr:hypothetical protein [Streptomyces sp. TML10]